MREFGFINLITAAAQGCLVAVAAPLIDGLIRKVIARVQSRRGPSIFQSYYDLLKLLCKEDIEVSDVPLTQRLVACGAVAVMLLMAAVLPLGAASPLGHVTDSILVVHLLTLSAMTTLIAGAATGNTYAMIGVNREMLMMIGLEPLLAIAIFVGVVHSGSFAVDKAVIGGIYNGRGFPFSALLILMLVVYGFPAYLQRAPFDLAEAETEIMGGPLLEYSGPKLALLKWAHMIRTLLYSALFVDLFVPWIYDLQAIVAFVVFWVLTLLVAVLFSTWAAVHARCRIDQAVRLFAGLLLAGAAGLWLASIGY